MQEDLEKLKDARRELKKEVQDLIDQRDKWKKVGSFIRVEKGLT